MKISKSIDQIISESVEEHVLTCIDRVNKGFKVVEVEVPLEYSSKVFTKLNDEISYGTRMYGWQFGVFTQGEFEGKVAQTFLNEDNRVFKRYFLKYTL
jgi:hypothetical protein